MIIPLPRLLIGVILWFIVIQTNGQIKMVRYDSIPVEFEGEILQNPWAGGLNSPQFSALDLNGDGREDLVVFERDFYGIVKPFLNNGSTTGPAYTYAPFYRHAFPAMSNWALWADYNCDGKADLFTDVPFGIAVYRNDYQPASGLRFTRVSALLKSETPDGQETLYAASPDIPAITDVDLDGDLDILVFGILGSSVEYHKNLSMENYGECDHLEFELKNRCWGYFSENDNTNGITLYDTCPENVPDPEKSVRHAGSTVLALDLDGDGAKDLLLGDLSYNNLVMLMNGGTPDQAVMVNYDSLYPQDIPVDLTVFPAAFHVDVNNDMVKDLLVAPNNPVRSENKNNIWLYHNDGTDVVPGFEYQTNRFLQEDMIDLGEGARPVFFDYDGDSLLDLVMGNYGYFISDGIYDSKLALYRNTGDASNPVFSWITDDFSSLSSLSLNGVYPAFGDLTGDGVPEMIIGDEQGRLFLFSDQSAEGEPANFILEAPYYKSIDVGDAAMPQIVDVDRDGKNDLLIGERGGTIDYFRNIGTPAEPEFSTSPTSDFFGGIDMMIPCCGGYSSPFLTRDSLGQSILYVGSERGWLYLYDDIDGNLDGVFHLADSLNLYALRATISGADITGDGRRELVYGEYTGGVSVLKPGQPEFLTVEETAQVQGELEIWPNPASTIVRLILKSEPGEYMESGEVYDLHGKKMESRIIPGKVTSLEWDVSKLESGLYFFRVLTTRHRKLNHTLVIH
jgi:hypothetical protein